MSETTAKYEAETDAFDELVKALNDLNQEIHNPASVMARIDYLLTKSPKASELVPKFDNALKACNLRYSPDVDRLWMLLRCLRHSTRSLEQLVHDGIFYIEEAILGVLFEAKQEGNPFVRGVDIQRKIGIYQKWKEDEWLSRSVLYKLEADERVRQDGKGGPFEITDAEYEKRK